jgi:hypothetical protein
MNPHDRRLLAELERQAAACWTYAALGWAAQRRGDHGTAITCFVNVLALSDAFSARVYSGAYVKGRPVGVRTKHRNKRSGKARIDDFKAHLFMIEECARTGERRGETLARAAWAAGTVSGSTEDAAVKRLGRWWNRPKKK